MPENYFQLRPHYIPGDFDFYVLSLKPEDPVAGMIFKDIQAGVTLF